MDEYVTHSPDGRTTFYSTTFQNGRRVPNPAGANDPLYPPNVVIRDFQSMMGNFMGPGFQQGPAGRSGPEALYVGGQGRPQVFGGSFTFTTGPRARGAGANPNAQTADDLATYASPASSRSDSGHMLVVISVRGSPDQLARILAGLFGPMGLIPEGDPRAGGAGGAPGAANPLRGILASIFNPENAIAGDAVYSQEALDRIISTLMDQHPTSNEPGPASPEAISNLPKKKLDEKMLGPELKGECSVCMDDVHVDDEVVVLPCTHWFHEACASAWLSEHNTCPICRTGIGGEQAPPPSHNHRFNSVTVGSQPPPPIDPNDPLRASARERLSRRMSRINTEPQNRNLLDPIFTEPEYQGRRRIQVVGPHPYINNNRSPSPSNTPGSFRRRNSEMSENQREARRTNTSGSDQSRQSSNSGQSSGGPMSWFRRFSGGGSGGGNSPRRE